MNQPASAISDTAAAIASLLSPRVIAIIGASNDPAKIGAMPLQFLQRYGYRGKLYPVNPNYREIAGLPCYPSVAAIPEPVDLMVVTVPAGRVPDVLRECSPGKVRAALVLSSGYAEMGAEGARLQSELVRMALERGIRICGPNSVGSVNLWEAVVPSISQAFDKILDPGPVALVTQSGALGTAVIALARAAGVRLGYFISTGNEGDLDFADFCDYFVRDPNTRIIAGYLEGLRDGRKFAAVARRALAAGKPIVLLKVGRSEAGAQAARSHTGALTGSDDLYRAVFASTGVVEVDSIEGLIDALKLFTALDPPKGNRAVIVTHSGGTGVLMSDACTDGGIAVQPTGEGLRAQLRELLPPFAALNNPIDMTATVIFRADLMTRCLEAALASPDFDMGFFGVNLMWRVRDLLADELIRLRERTRKPFAVTWIGIPDDVAARLQEAGVPSFSDPVRTVAVMSRLVQWHRTRQRQTMHPSTEPDPTEESRKDPLGGAVTERGGRSLPSDYGSQAALLSAYGIPLAPWRLVRSADEALAAASFIGYPVVAKIVDPGHSHKSDIGGVAINLRTPGELKDALGRFSQIADWTRPPRGVLIQEMISDALEVFVGAQRDPVFGPYVVVGLGGIYVEVLKEMSLCLAPITVREALDLVEGARWSPLLMGIRGRPPRDVAALAEIIHRISLLVVHEPVQSMDLNPVMVRMTGEGAVVVDFRIFGFGESGA